jgi:hypothetical protein
LVCTIRFNVLASPPGVLFALPGVWELAPTDKESRYLGVRGTHTTAAWLAFVPVGTLNIEVGRARGDDLRDDDLTKLRFLNAE